MLYVGIYDASILDYHKTSHPSSLQTALFILGMILLPVAGFGNFVVFVAVQKDAAEFLRNLFSLQGDPISSHPRVMVPLRTSLSRFSVDSAEGHDSTLLPSEMTEDDLAKIITGLAFGRESNIAMIADRESASSPAHAHGKLTAVAEESETSSYYSLDN